MFLNQIQHLVSVLEQAKKAGAELSDFSSELTITELHRISSLVEKTHEIEAGLIAGTATGALAAFGAFSTAGILGTASTGTAVSTLTGAAASNATLAWFGGGSLAAGGFGMAGGMVILGGIVVAPVFAAGGLVMARKAQKAVKEARDYADKVDKELLLMQKAEAAMQEIRTAADALGQVILRLARRFEQVKVCSCTDPGFRSMVQTGLTLKKLLDIPVMRQDGTANPEVKERCRECLDRAHLDTASFMQDFHDPKVQDMKL